jgi:hypothetical protein
MKEKLNEMPDGMVLPRWQVAIGVLIPIWVVLLIVGGAELVNQIPVK